jgi:hypothetical protein
MLLNEYEPLSFVVCVRLKFFAGLVSVTVAPETTFPWASVTVPATDEVPVWANVFSVITEVTSRTKRSRTLGRL